MTKLDRAIEACIAVMSKKSYLSSYAGPREAFRRILLDYSLDKEEKPHCECGKDNDAGYHDIKCPLSWMQNKDTSPAFPEIEELVSVSVGKTVCEYTDETIRGYVTAIGGINIKDKINELVRGNSAITKALEKNR